MKITRNDVAMYLDGLRATAEAPLPFFASDAISEAIDRLAKAHREIQSKRNTLFSMYAIHDEDGSLVLEEDTETGFQKATFATDEDRETFQTEMEAFMSEDAGIDLPTINRKKLQDVAERLDLVFTPRVAAGLSLLYEEEGE